MNIKPINYYHEFRAEYDKQRSRRARRRKFEAFSFYAGVFIKATIIGVIVTFAVVQTLSIVYTLLLTAQL